ncbi:MAG: transposase [Steroidobacteraceae bacterium]
MSRVSSTRSCSMPRPRQATVCGTNRDVPGRSALRARDPARGVHHRCPRRNQGLDPAQRLQLHQDESQPRMAALERWMQAQFAERKIEPNSSLGAAILYMQKRWSELTLFLRVQGAPLDNNTSERALKKAILHRKNALFYRTLAGAHVGDVFMSLIHSAELNHVAPFEYLVALQRNAADLAANPAAWMPWNYQAALANHPAGPDPPG